MTQIPDPENLLETLCFPYAVLSHARPLGWGVGVVGECSLVSVSAIAPHCVMTGSLHFSLGSLMALRPGRGNEKLAVLNSFAASALVCACARQ